jgi:hypothetical protein
MNNYYTYAYLREDGTPYYIGKGRNKRINSIHRGGLLPLPPMERRIFLKKNLTEEEAFEHEKYMIALFGRKDLGNGILLNMSEGGESGGNRIAPNRKNIILFGKKYDSIKNACADNNITYQQYRFLIDENLLFDNSEDLKKFIWERRNNKISIGQIGNSNKRGWKSNPVTYAKQSKSIKMALQNKKNKYS